MSFINHISPSAIILAPTFLYYSILQKDGQSVLFHAIHVVLQDVS